MLNTTTGCTLADATWPAPVTGRKATMSAEGASKRDARGRSRVFQGKFGERGGCLSGERSAEPVYEVHPRVRECVKGTRGAILSWRQNAAPGLAEPEKKTLEKRVAGDQSALDDASGARPTHRVEAWCDGT